RSAWAFIVYSAVRGNIRGLKPGEYEVPRDASTATVAAMVENGRVRQHPVLQPEGATMTELARAMEAAHLARAAARFSPRTASRARAPRAISFPTPTSSCAG